MRDIDDAIEKKLIPLWKTVAGVETINKNSAWYIYIQGQLHIASKSTENFFKLQKWKRL